MSPGMVEGMVLYAVYLSQYANDAVCNLCKNLEESLNAAGYKSKYPFKVYGALMRRCNGYFSTMNKSEMESMSLSYVYSELDEVVDPLVTAIQDEMETFLNGYGLKQPRLIAQMETILTLAAFAIDISESFCKDIAPYDKDILTIKDMGCRELMPILGSLLKFVVDMERLPDDADINLNDCHGATEAFVRFKETYLDPNMFVNAYNKANLY